MRQEYFRVSELRAKVTGIMFCSETFLGILWSCPLSLDVKYTLEYADLTTINPLLDTYLKLYV